jgi:uncharacterized protein
MSQRVLKPSKFNCIFSEEGKLIIFNYLNSRFIKEFPEKYTTQIIDILDKKEIVYDADDFVVKKLAEFNFLIDVECDEEALSALDYMCKIATGSLVLTVVPTMSCNFVCPYCYQERNEAVMTDEIRDAIIKYVLKNINRYNSVTTSWFGGEPLLCIDTITYISEKLKNICKNRYRRYTSSMTTNGYYLTKTNFLRLLDCNITQFNITIDGIKDTHDKQRMLRGGGDSFDTIIKNLLEIKDINHSKYFEINIRTNVSNDVLNVISDYAKFMQDHFGDDERFGFYFRPVYDWGGQTICEFKDHVLQGREVYNSIYEKLITSPYHLNYRLHYLDLMSSSVCHACSKNSFIILPDGKLIKCSCDNSMHRNNNIGFLNTNGNMEVDQWKVALWGQKYKNKDVCKNCNSEPKCHSASCPASWIVHNQEERSCEQGKSYMESFVKLLSKSNGKYHYIDFVNCEDE